MGEGRAREREREREDKLRALRATLPHAVGYPLCGETLEPLARFVRKLPKDSSFADEGFPGLKNRNSSGRVAPITPFIQLSEPDKLFFF